ncbi:N-acylhomoserine lactone synthase [Caballeronia calidae]|uniref:Acyl-homoserine-lactone synthase n=2 Tax=Caballeronia calidae TaxID=1777139 RepID=A0A158EJK4_9BURK|nr:N-acylhomoserine lactone synthase [Caballeronia calidae]
MENSLRIIVRPYDKLSPSQRRALAQFRHEIFVNQLSWQLNEARAGLEMDQYDTHHATYVLAYSLDGELCGCARLISTIHRTMLAEQFKELLGSTPMPQARGVWELSRLAIRATSVGPATDWPIKAILRVIVSYTLKQGGRQLVGVMFLSMERLLRRIGVLTHRIAGSRTLDGKKAVACQMDLGSQTQLALGLR